MEEKSKGKPPLVLKFIIPILIMLSVLTLFAEKNAQAQKNKPSMLEVTFPLNITSITLDEIKTYGVTAIIDFGSYSCIPCKEMTPILEKINNEVQCKAAVQFWDIFKYRGDIKAFPVIVMPTQLLFNADGTPFIPSNELNSEIEFKMHNYDNGNHMFTSHAGALTEEQMRKILKEMGVK